MIYSVHEYRAVNVQQTVDATATAVYGFEIPEGTVVTIRVAAAAQNLSNGDSAAYYRSATFKRSVGGAASQVGTTTSTMTSEDAGAAAWDCTLTLSSDTININVIGVAATTIDWICNTEVALYTNE
mgnify:CR=1 FL=1